MSVNRLWFCGTCTTPMSRICRGDLPFSFSPRSVTVPSRGRSRPLITRMTVDLPAPFGPTTQVMAALGHREGDAAQHVAATVARHDAVHGKQRLGHRLSSSAGRSFRACVLVFRACVLVEVSAQVGVEHALVRPHDLRRPAHHGRARLEHRDRRAQSHDELHVVLDEQERLALLGVEQPDAVGDQVDQRRVHPAGRLVEQDDRRVGDEHVGEFEQLALAVGERARQDARVPLDADELEQFQSRACGAASMRPGRTRPAGSAAGPWPAPRSACSR